MSFQIFKAINRLLLFWGVLLDRFRVAKYIFLETISKSLQVNICRPRQVSSHANVSCLMTVETACQVRVKPGLPFLVISHSFIATFEVFFLIVPSSKGNCSYSRRLQPWFASTRPFSTSLSAMMWSHLAATSLLRGETGTMGALVVVLYVSWPTLFLHKSFCASMAASTNDHG